jgi:hypothetical protein
MRLSVILTVMTLAACGGAQAQPVTTSNAGGFDAMSVAQKQAFMRGTVAPEMKTEFQTFDGHDFAVFDCKTCHGAGASTGNFKMPNPDLPKLDVAHAFAKDLAAHPKEMEFMQQKVQPRMAKMLGQPEHSDAQPDGFGCMDCHTARE